MNDTPPEQQCSITHCSSPAVYLCAVHECVPGLVNTPQLCRDCYLALERLLHTAFLGDMPQTCPRCGEVFAGPQDMLRVLEEGTGSPPTA